jgi:cytochrome c oxidase cbb3-type subunit 3
MAENNPFPGENNTGHYWDDNLRELANPPPSWWMIAFWASILWVVAYGILYPFWPTATSHTKGVLGWTSMQEYQEGVAQIQETRKEFEDQIAKMTPAEIAQDPGLSEYTVASAKVLFGDHCAACHGSGGAGNVGYPVLADDDWLYGGSFAKIQESITGGRQGAMTAHEKILTPAEVDQLANFVVAMHDGGPAAGGEEGWALFKAKGCTACHGEKADGVLAKLPNGDVVTVGAANLTDKVWRFEPAAGETPLDSVKHTILYGVNQAGVKGTRDAVMPGFGTTKKLGEQDIKKLTVYVHQLGGGK